MENGGIVREVAAVARSQDMPFFEVGEGVFDNEDPAPRRISKNSATSKFGIAGLVGGRQRAVFRLFLRQNYRRRMFVLKALITGSYQNRKGWKWAFGFTDFEVMNTAFIELRYAQNLTFWLDDNFSFVRIRELFEKSFP